MGKKLADEPTEALRFRRDMIESNMASNIWLALGAGSTTSRRRIRAQMKRQRGKIKAIDAELKRREDVGAMVEAAEAVRDEVERRPWLGETDEEMED